MEKDDGKALLLAGAGDINRNDPVPLAFDGYSITTLDVDEGTHPDIVASMCDMSAVGDCSYDGVFAKGCIEHLDPWDVPRAMGEFYRVLKPGGRVIVTTMDFLSVCVAALRHGLHGVVYETDIGGITPMDMIYGHRGERKNGRDSMLHRTIFTQETLNDSFSAAGFKDVKIVDGDGGSRVAMKMSGDSVFIFECALVGFGAKE